MLDALALAWAALSSVGLGLGAAGGGVLASAALGLRVVPGWLLRPLVTAGLILLAGGALYKTAYTRATLAAAARTERKAAKAERIRAERAEAISHDLAIRADRDRAELAAGERRLQELTDALQTRPDRDRVCVPRDLADRLRKL